METNTTAATVYSLPDEVPEVMRDETAENITLWQLPKLLWAGSLLFAVNLAIAATIAISPEMNVSILGVADNDVITAGTRTSPFAAPESEKPRPVRVAMKLRPVVETSEDVMAIHDSYLAAMPVSTASLAIRRSTPQARPAAAEEMPRSTETARSAIYRQAVPAYVSGDKVYDYVEKESNLSRYTATPRASVPLVRTSAIEIAPRRVTERAVRPVVVN